jgi:uncharacterized cupredoxin-like copper-binding protein
MPMRAAHFMATAVAVVGLAFAACGDDDDNGGSNAPGGSGRYGSANTTEQEETQAQAGGGTTLRLSADPGGALKFDKSSLTANAGEVTIALTNPASATAPHAVEIEGQGVEEESDTIQPGESANVTAQLEPGTYEFYCPVGNHKDAGMEGTLTVN